MIGITDMKQDHWDTMKTALRYYDDVIYDKLTDTENRLSDVHRQAWTEQRNLVSDCKRLVPLLHQFFEIKE